jgi:hypothetical protein
MTNTSLLTKASKHLVAQLTATAFAGMLATIVAADTASAETLQHLRNDLKMREFNKPKVRAGSLPGHPNKMISTTPKRPPPAPTTRIVREPNPDEPGYVAPVRHGRPIDHPEEGLVGQ